MKISFIEELCGEDYKHKMASFTSNLHDIYTEMKNKMSLCHHDDKRFVIPNTTNTSEISFHKTDPEINVQYAWYVLNEFINNDEELSYFVHNNAYQTNQNENWDL